MTFAVIRITNISYLAKTWRRGDLLHISVAGTSWLSTQITSPPVSKTAPTASNPTAPAAPVTAHTLFAVCQYWEHWYALNIVRPSNLNRSGVDFSGPPSRGFASLRPVAILALRKERINKSYGTREMVTVAGDKKNYDVCVLYELWMFFSRYCTRNLQHRYNRLKEW